MTTDTQTATRTPERSREQRWAEDALTPHPHRLELRGSPRDLSWPDICAYCGMPASERIVVKKAFRPLPRRRSSAGVRPYRIGAAAIPLCAGCSATHRATVRRPSAVKKAMHLLLNPLIIPVAGFMWISTVVWRQFEGTSIPDIGWFPGWGIRLFLAAALAWCVFVLWSSTRPSRLDPQTEVTRACDFSDDVSGYFEQERRIYSIRNKAFADRMAAMNADRVWTAGDQKRSMKMQFVLAVLMLAALAAIAGYIKLTGQ